MKNYPNPMYMFGVIHNNYLDFYLNNAFKFFVENSSDRDKGNRNDWFEKWFKDILTHPCPPFNPELIRPIYTNSPIFDPKFEDKVDKKIFANLIDQSIKSRNDKVSEIKNIEKIFEKEEIQLLEKLQLSFKCSNYNETKAMISKLEIESFEISSKKNYPIISSIMSIGKLSNQYWGEDFFNREWVKDAFSDNLDKIAKASPGGRIGAADVGGAVGGAVYAAAANVIPGVGQVVWGGAVLGGAIGGSCVQGFVELADWLDWF